MKNIILLLVFFWAFNALSSIEYDPKFDYQVTQAEVDSNRACFRELETLGCGDPADGAKHFRECVRDVRDTLTENCQKLVSKLYKR